MIGRIGREALSADSVDPKTMQRLEESIMDQALGGYDWGREDTSGDGSEPTT